ncbi:hypothetical protein KR044_009559, partial [Drosophila immigrans]
YGNNNKNLLAEIPSTVGSRKSTVDEELQNGLEADDLDNGVEASPPSDSIANDSVDQTDPATGLSKERDAGTDLDALLDKISSIVDCDPKESVEEEDEANSAHVEADGDGSEQPADGIDNNEDCDPAIDGRSSVIETEEEQKEDNKEDTEVKEEDRAEISDEKKDKQNISELEKHVGEEVEEEEIVDSKDKAIEVKTIESPEVKTTASDVSDTKTTKLVTTGDDILVEALETISSSDEFDAIPESKSIPKKETTNGLEDITSDDSLDKEDPATEMPQAEPAIIDLDALDDTPKEESVEDSEKENTLKDNVMDVDKSIEEKVEEEAKVDTKKVDKVQLTGTQELQDDDIDNMLLEADKTCVAKTEEATTEAAKPKKNEDLVKADKEDLTATETVKTNGTEEKVDDQTSENEPDSKDSKEAESDDEVIFFESIDKMANKTIATKESAKEKPEADKDVELVKREDEVVLVSEDEDEVSPAKQSVEEKSSKKSDEEATTTTETDAKSKSDLLLDNSDNACDQFEKQRERAQDKTPPKVGAAEDSNSSNLLQPTQKSQDETVGEAEAEAEAETTTEVDQGDVEADDEIEEPAVKRIRLSTDDKPEASNSFSCTVEAEATTSTTNTTSTSTSTSTSINIAEAKNENEDEAQPAVAKRNHSSSEQKEDIPSKKLKTDDTDSNSSCDGNLQIDLDAHDNTEESETPAESTKEKIKEPPIELKPAPELKSDVKPLRLDFVKRFRKSFDKMTRCDLEELVLQKVVEGMLVKSEFAEIRRQVDKQEATLANYRRKIAEVSKQFLDLETVHKRVLKDLETRNSHFTAPVRITRAVGLQVGMTLMKKPSEDTTRSQPGLHTAGSMPAPAPASTASTSNAASTATPASTSSLPQKPTTSPKAAQRSPLRGMTRAGLVMQHPNQPPPQQQQEQQRSSLNYSPAGGNATPPVRRGCMQKVTPQRPVNNSTQSSPGSGPGGMQRLQTPPGSSSSRVYATKHTGNSAAASTAAAATAAVMRSRGAAGKPAGAAVRIGRVPGKPNNAKVRSMPMGGGTVSVPMSNASADSTGAGYGQPSLAPARPKEKAVIDLTDEDDAAAAAAAEVTARLRQNPNVGIKRSAASGAGSARPVAGSVVRVSPMNVGRTNAVSRQIVHNNSAGQRNSVGANVTMQIRSENTPPSPSRLRFSHPAPLPLAPAQTFHPDWRLPPSRPVIRISLHDTGIVISWTLEDTGSRFAECVTYQIYAYQETINEPSTDSWRHVGDVKAMLLPMAVTLNQFQENQRYFFAVRGVDAHDRYGIFSLPKTW